MSAEVSGALVRAHTLLPRHAASDAAGPVVRLSFDDRHRRRMRLTTQAGEALLLDLPAAEKLRDGDRIALEDGRILRIEAADEDVVDVTAPDPLTLRRLAWHLGNRHTPTAILPDRLRIRRDHVLEAMIVKLGGQVQNVLAPFDPEVGAYHDGGGHGHGHSQAHEHGHDHHHHHHDASGPSD